MRHWSLLVITLAMLVSCDDGHHTSKTYADVPALEKMEAVFAGNYTKHQIEVRMTRALRLFGLPETEANLARYGSVLVVLRTKGGGAHEMDILTCAIAMREEYSGPGMDLGEALAICATTLAVME